MAVLYFYGDNPKIKKELKDIVSQKNIFLEYTSFSDLEDNSLVFVDFTNIGKRKWKDIYPKDLPLPKELEINNIRVIAIILKENDNVILDLLDNEFSDFIEYPFFYPRVLATFLNTIRDIEYEKELSSLYQIGIDLSSQADLEKLLEEILKTAQDFTNSDGGSIYLVLKEHDKSSGEKLMQFEISISDTLGKRYEKIKMPINTNSLAGYVITTGKNLNIIDTYSISEDLPYKFNSSFDKENNYRSKSILVVPMVNHKGEIIGAIQLINRKKDRNVILDSKEKIEEFVIDFDHKCELLIRSLGSQATIAIENARLYKEIQDLFESFMEASINAVESRDPTTAGHSRRVSKLSVAIAEYINMINDGPLKDVKFSDDDIKCIKYAGLLHDFGKIGIPEKILLKATRLFSEEISNIDSRIELLKYNIYLEEKESELNSFLDLLKKIEELRNAIYAANQPSTYVDQSLAEKLKEANETEVKLLDQKKIALLKLEEYEKLVNAKGSLSRDEYKIMQTHVEYSYKFLNLIKWPKGLERIPLIARCHHEKMDGSGYPLGITANMIPLESQIMCIADIFDALISSDRPYKHRITPQKAIEILQKEANDGKINKDILEVMVREEIYKIIIE